MRHLFLADSTVNHLNFEDYKMGLIELNAIDKIRTDQFNKSPNAIYSSNYANLYQQYSQENQLLATFIEQLSTCDQTISSEEEANSYCGSDINGFLGIDFSTSSIPIQKSVTNQGSYNEWSFIHSTSLQRLDSIVGKNTKSENFAKEFLQLSQSCQDSIIELFQRAKGRSLVTPFYPDTKIVSDVSQDKFSFHVRELRVYTPVALRVYFHEAENMVYLGGISFKSSPNQSQDIFKMYTRINDIM